MRTTLKERAEVVQRLVRLGVSFDDANKLRRCAMTLRNWFELECGTGDERITRSIEREGADGDGRPFLRVQFLAGSQWQDKRYPVADKEADARKRLAATMSKYDNLLPYVQGDCRGASVWILRKADVDGQEIDSIYTRGVAVY